MSNFVHLHVHDEGSINDSLAKINHLVERADELGMEALATTNHGNLFSVVHFYKACKKKGIKPIIGTEAYVCPTGKKDKVRDNRHIVLLCKNETGYKNLVKIMSDAATEGFYYDPRTDYEMLRKHSEGLICLTACLGGDVPKTIEKEGYEKGVEKLRIYTEIFGEENVYLEVQDNGMEDQYVLNEKLMKMSEETGIPLVATGDIHYVNKEDFKYHDILMALQAGVTVDSDKRKVYDSDEYYMKSREEFEKSGKLPVEALDNTVNIANRCNFELDLGSYHIPPYTIPDGYRNPLEYLRKIAYDGLRYRYGNYTKEHSDRLDYELSVIKDMGYVTYFLIVWDFIDYARKRGIPVGPGRGSAAGSILSYVLRITDIEPLRFGLIFERFLNPARQSMPDIDIDFCYERRQEVIDYVENKYGSERVCQIITFGRYAARAAIRAVGRALDTPYVKADKIAKAVPEVLGISLKDALKDGDEFSDMYENDAEAKEVIDAAIAIENLPSHTSTHAAGVLISPEPVDDLFPVWLNDGVTVTQFDMNMLEECGGLKFDFLGLKTLTVIDKAIKKANERRGLNLTYDDILAKIDDPESFKLIREGNTLGVFQLESEGMRDTAKAMNIQNIEETTALVSLYRPGPMDMIPTYINGKNNPESVKYKIPELKDLLEETYGVLTYQEQVMFAAQILAGYSMADSDMLRRAMGKKKKEIIDEHREYFINGDKEKDIEGGVNKGFDGRDLEDIYNEIENFARYAFNKSHAVSYAFLAAMTSYLKNVYAPEFMSAILTIVLDDKDKVSSYMSHCESDLGIKVYPPSINLSTDMFEPDENGDISFSLAALKNVGIQAAIDIKYNREVKGDFKCFRDFVMRCAGGNVTSAAIETLIRVDAFGEFGKKRSELLSVMYDNLDEAKKLNSKFRENSQVLLLEPDERYIFTKDETPELLEIKRDILLEIEKDLAGIYLSGHPTDMISTWAKAKCSATSKDFSDDNNNSRIRNKSGVSIAGVLKNKKVIKTKKGDSMAFAELEDKDGVVSLVIFPSQYERLRRDLKEGELCIVKGEANRRDPSSPLQLVVNIVKYAVNELDILLFKIESKSDIINIKRLVSKYKGNIPVYLVYKNSKTLLEERYWVSDKIFKPLDELGVKYNKLKELKGE